MRTTVHLPDDLLRRAKQKAAADGRTLTSLIEEGLRVVLASKPVNAKPNESPLPISSVTGCVLDGVDLTSNSTVQSILDEEVMFNAGMNKLR